MRRDVNTLLWLVLLVLTAGCARIVAPVGGPKDMTPPTIVKEVPANNSVFFTGHGFKITFDEFVVLQNTTENVLISPPLSSQPTYSLSGKTLTVKFSDTLRPNQTYSFAFANCIKDFTEGNPIPIYNYSFSTGSYVDSFMLKGKVVDAVTASAVDNCYILAYINNVDSLPCTTRPDFVTKSQKDGNFSINNIPSGQYKLFALKDVNNNMLFDQPNESVAFFPQTVAAIPMPRTDTITDSTRAETVSSRVQQFDSECVLRMFEEADTMQSYVKMQNKEAGKYELFYKNKISDPHINVLSEDTVSFFPIIGNDTLTLYFKQIPADTVTVEVAANGKCCDTLKLTPFQKRNVRTRGKRENKNFLSVTPLNQGELYKPLVLKFSYPIHPVDSFEVQVVSIRRQSGNDTSYLRLSVPDTFVNQVVIPMKWEEKVSYNLFIRDSVFEGYNNLVNDSIKVNFTAKTEKNYGSLHLSYKLPAESPSYITQLLGEKGEVLMEKAIHTSQVIVYENLPEGKYKIKVIEDSNGDGEWTPGDYRKSRLPERVFYFPKQIFVRGNWDLEEEFQL